MTRVNLVEPEQLSNSHLMAEYREMPRVFRRAILNSYKGRMPNECPIAETYTLNKGHEYFFVDKCDWLYKRWHAIRKELLKRDYNLGDDFVSVVKARHRHVRKHCNQFNGGYKPKPEEIYLNRLNSYDSNMFHLSCTYHDK